VFYLLGVHYDISELWKGVINMAKIGFFTVWREDSETVGINLKIQNQVKAFSNIGLDSYFCVSASDSVRIYEAKNDDLILSSSIPFSKNAVYKDDYSLIKRKYSSFKRLNECLKAFDELVNSVDCDYIYIRRILPLTNNLAKYIKKWHKEKRKVIWEIPTWNSHEKTPYGVFLLGQEKFMLKLLGNNISQIVAIYSADEIPPKNVLFINNGVNTKNVPIKKLKEHDGINLVCLATFSYWHGYDRLINGLADYIKNKNGNECKINIYMVGNGNVDELKELASSKGVEKYIHFTGVLMGKDLDTFFDEMDIAVGNLGFFREGVFSDTSIKIREYCARGIPFVTALAVNDFPKDYEYIHSVPMDESYINIEDIIN